jgi:hypothetical protein
MINSIVVHIRSDAPNGARASDFLIPAARCTSLQGERVSSWRSLLYGELLCSVLSGLRPRREREGRDGPKARSHTKSKSLRAHQIRPIRTCSRRGMLAPTACPASFACSAPSSQGDHTCAPRRIRPERRVIPELFFHILMPYHSELAAWPTGRLTEAMSELWSKLDSIPSPTRWIRGVSQQALARFHGPCLGTSGGLAMAGCNSPHPRLDFT